MAYLPSGTTYPTFTSNLLPGIASGGQDYVGKFYNSLADISGTNFNQLNTSRTFHNFSGANAYSIGTFSPSTLTVSDTFGGAGGATITVSGATSGIRFNGATTATITSAYGTKTFVNVSGNNWNVF